MSFSIQGVPKNTDKAQYIVQDDKLISYQDGTPVRNRTVWALESIEVAFLTLLERKVLGYVHIRKGSISHVVDKPNMSSRSLQSLRERMQ